MKAKEIAIKKLNEIKSKRYRDLHADFIIFDYLISIDKEDVAEAFIEAKNNYDIKDFVEFMRVTRLKQ
jgi:hypothetical protein